MPAKLTILLVLLFLNVLADIPPARVSVPADGMALIPAGRFQPLFRAEQETNDVPVDAFLLDIVPVTNAEFLEFVKLNPKWRRSSVSRLFADPDYLKHWQADLELGTNTAPNAPVTYVSWFAAKAFARSKGKRLPTTAEWEYAAAASPALANGDKDPAFVRELRQWYSTPSPERLAGVGQKRANFYRVHDLHGLIWEWVSDFSTAMVTGDARGDTGLDRQLFCAGGSQSASDRDNFPAFMRYGFRSSLKANYTVHNLGFRCALSATDLPHSTLISP